MQNNITSSTHSNVLPMDFNSALRGRLNYFGIELSKDNLSELGDFLKQNSVLIQNISPRTKEVFYRSLNENMIFNSSELGLRLDLAIADDSKDKINYNIVTAFNEFMRAIPSSAYTFADRKRCLDLFLKHELIPSKETCYPHIIGKTAPVLTVQDNYLWIRDLFAKQIGALKFNLDIYTKNEWDSLENYQNLTKGKMRNIKKKEQVIFPSIKLVSSQDEQDKKIKMILDTDTSNIANFVIYPVFFDGTDASVYLECYSLEDILCRIGDNVKGFIWKGGSHNIGQMLQKHVVRMYVKTFAGVNSVISAIDIMQAEDGRSK